MNTDLIDPELEQRVRRAFDRVIPILTADPDRIDAAAAFVDPAGPVAAVDIDATTRPSAPRRPRVALLAAAAVLVVAGLVAAAVAGRHDDPAPTAGTVAGSGATPAWYGVVRPIIPERFTYLALTSDASSRETTIVAVDPLTAKTLDIGIIWDPESGEPGITVTCSIGGRAVDFVGAQDYCDLASTGPFTQAEIDAVTEQFAALDPSVFATMTASRSRVLDHEAVVDAILGAVPEQRGVATAESGAGDSSVELMADDGSGAQTSVRVIHGLFPTPPPSGDPVWALYDDAAAFWTFGADGTAVRISTKDASPESLQGLQQLADTLLAGDLLDLVDPATQEPQVATTTIAPTPTTTEPAPGTTATPAARAPTRVLPAAMPAGFDDVADGFTTDVESAQVDPATTRLFAGSGEEPAVVMLISQMDQPGFAADAEPRLFSTTDGFQGYRFGVARPSGRDDFLATGGLTSEQVTAIADALGAVETLDPAPITLPYGLTEVPFEHHPDDAHTITWNGADGAQIVMLVESAHGIDALRNGISWPIQNVDTGIGPLFVSVDPTDSTFLQAGTVIGGAVINVEARGVTPDELITFVASITTVDDVTWSARVHA